VRVIREEERAKADCGAGPVMRSYPLNGARLARVASCDWETALRVKLGGKLDVRRESAFPTITDIVDYGPQPRVRVHPRMATRL
jgi:hypothetical protein